MLVEVLGVMIPFAVIGGATLIVINLRKYENQERMAMIEKGVNTDLFKKQQSTSLPLRLSLLCIGIGVGLLVGLLLSEVVDNRAVCFVSMTFIFGGLGLGAAYLVEEKKFQRQR